MPGAIPPLALLLLLLARPCAPVPPPAAPTEVLVTDVQLLSALTVQPLDPSLREQFQVPANRAGVIIAALPANSPAAALGLRQGDVIVRVNGLPTPTREALLDAAVRSTALHDGGRRLRVEVVRQGQVVRLARSGR